MNGCMIQNYPELAEFQKLVTSKQSFNAFIRNSLYGKSKKYENENHSLFSISGQKWQIL